MIDLNMGRPIGGKCPVWKSTNEYKYEKYWRKYKICNGLCKECGLESLINMLRGIPDAELNDRSHWDTCDYDYEDLILQRQEEWYD